MIPAQQEQFKFPRELERRPPRAVHRKPGTLGCGIIAVRFFSLVLLGAGLFLLGRAPVVSAVVTKGASFPGQVEKTWTSRGSKGSTNYHLKYSYQVGGQFLTDTRSVSKSQFNLLSPQTPLDVRVLDIGGHLFDECFLPGEWHWKPVWLAILFAAIVNVIAGFMVYAFLIVPSQHKALCRQGKPIMGRISRMHSSSGKTTTYYLDYQWDHPGLGIRTATMTVTSDRWHQAQVGEAVTVLCIPNLKRPTVMYEYGDFECA